MNAEDCRAVTLSYYEAWLGERGCLTDGEGVCFICSGERNLTQLGHTASYGLYVWRQTGKTAVSYCDAVREGIGKLKLTLMAGKSADEVAALLAGTFGHGVRRSVKYLYTGSCRASFCAVKTLAADDYGDYEAFFRRCHPQSGVNWLREYFDGMTRLSYCVGVYVDGAIASCTDAPSMPYMPDKVQEIGINTLPEHRSRGYAAAACAAAAENILLSGKAPLWSAPMENVASQRLAERVGFAKIADVFTVKIAE